jgi:membrane fusion protein, multidrug efflux system
VSERAIGTDQNKKFVMVLDEANRVAYREITVGATVDGLRLALSGLGAGERVIVNGSQRVRPGDFVTPQLDATASIGAASVTQR